MRRQTRVFTLLLLGLSCLVILSACGSNAPEEQQANTASASPVISSEPTPAETQEATIAPTDSPTPDKTASPTAKPSGNAHEGGHSSGNDAGAKNTEAPPKQTATPKPKPSATQPAKETPSAKPEGQVHIVEIVDFAYSPAELTVKPGDSVKFMNKDQIGHTATADDKTFDTGSLDLDESKVISFTEEGEFSYYCLPHPGMKGTIIVEAE
ncbi:plastocyanin/azurin family copper-binding protein [Paenibacillus sp. LHD-117]|uniref:cupredoxin domain-containing protein n=1 Tax=Paenibacillus sp. LHD-117 TaxID=3071412 RepID=UPI0027DED3E1|nr:plastocyanin/azurin family copper-binding protein [Paenibacillus sp. LHD-117]MDQ6422204.1 plastocyanin/azurin family copper-binding protein [Paenibacillus sp. LHD-117]